MTTKFKFRTPNGRAGSGSRTPHFALNGHSPSSSFSLVIAHYCNFAILAALILGGAGIAYVKSHRSRAETERAALITAIGQYKAHKGVYPPDNAINGINVNSALLVLCSTNSTGVVAANNVGNGNPGFIAVNGDRLAHQLGVARSSEWAAS